MKHLSKLSDEELVVLYSEGNNKAFDILLTRYKSRIYSYIFYTVKDNDLTVDKYLTSKIAKIGENISIRRFARFVVGEGIEKKESNLAEEVAAMQGGQN